MQVIKNRKIEEDHWLHVADDTIPPEGCMSVSLSRWRAEKSLLIEREGGELGIRLGCDDPVEEIADDLDQFQLVVIDFTKFADGRGFTTARLLRDRYRFRGEIRAMGDFLCEQIFYLSRVGVNAFELANREDLPAALAALNDLTVKYQAAADERAPLSSRERLP